ncbi:MAG TPA: outer membrane beta-barrel protein [Nitrospira sp.]|jgi:opacity protein-like surface antigen|nr:outer membrane beta-barrel protein [Nitrospira sp.]
MKHDYIARGTARLHTTALLLSLLLVAVPIAYGETYVAGQLGFAVPGIGGGLSDGDITSSFFLPGTTHGEFDLSSSFIFGGKIGHYFNSARWVGIEAEVFHATPHIDQQVHTFQNPSVPGVTASATFQGAYFRVLTLAPFNIMFRYPMTRLQPYIGVGPGIFFARIKGEGLAPDAPESTSDNATLGLNAKAGLEYYFTKHLTAFAEWKFNYAHFTFNENQNLFPFPYGLDATYTMHLISFGMGYHF